MENENRTLDPNLSLKETVAKENESTSVESAVEETPVTKGNDTLKSLISGSNPEPKTEEKTEEEEELSPLDKMMQERNQGGKGFVTEEEDPEAEAALSKNQFAMF